MAHTISRLDAYLDLAFLQLALDLCTAAVDHLLHRRRLLAAVLDHGLRRFGRRQPLALWHPLNCHVYCWCVGLVRNQAL